jgi:hypothetical protein
MNKITCLQILQICMILTYSMEQSPSWEANRFSLSQDIPRILWNPNVHYRIHTCPPPVRALSQIDLYDTEQKMASQLKTQISSF